MRLRHRIKTQTLVLLLVMTYAGIAALFVLANHVIPNTTNEALSEKTNDAANEPAALSAIEAPDDYEFVEPEYDYLDGIVLFPVNKNGLTYGYALDLDDDGVKEEIPEMIVASATNGATGYVKVRELTQEVILDDSNDEKSDAGYRSPVYVYDVEGETIIGYLDEESISGNETALRKYGNVIIVETRYGNEAVTLSEI